MKRSVGLAAALLTSVAFAPVALAADPVPPPVVIAPQPPPPPVANLAGYVDAHFGLEKGRFEEFFEGDPDFEEDWRNTILGGAGRGAWAISPSFTFQLDAWFNIWQTKDEEEVFNWGEGGVGTHFIFTTAGGLRAGGLVSVGRGDGTWINFAGEVAQSFGNFRLSAQAGYTIPLSGFPKEDGERSWYITAAGTFYITPDFAITANIGYDRWRETISEGDDLDIERTLSYGLRVEYGIGNTPLSIYAGFHSEHLRGVDLDEPEWTWIERERTYFAGVRMLIGRDTLQEMGDAVGFADYNAIFGDDMFAPR